MINEVVLEGLIKGQYGLGIKEKLYFQTEKNSNISIIIDKFSALEIMHTLLDSMNMLTKETEELICDIGEKLTEGD